MRKNSVIALSLVMTLSLCTACSNNEDTDKSNNQYLRWDLITDNYYLYSADGSKTEYLDFDTMNTDVYCSIPNCTHSSLSCMSNWFNGKMPIIYQNSVYYFVDGNEEDYDSDGDGREDDIKIESKIMKYDIEQETKEVFALWEGTTGETYLGAYVYNNSLYFIGESPYCEFADLPGSETPDPIPRQTLLYKLNLDTGEIKEFDEFYSDFKSKIAYMTKGMVLMGESDGKLWFSYSYIEDESKNDYTIDDRMADKSLGIDSYTYLCFSLNLENDEICLEDEEAPESIIDGYRCHTEDDGTAVIYKDGKTWSFQAEKWNFHEGILTLADDKVWHLGNKDSWYYDLKTEEKVSVSKFSDMESTVEVLRKYGDSYICEYPEDDKYAFEKIDEKELSGGENS